MRLLNSIIVATCLLLLSAAVASANSLTLAVTNNGGGAQAGNDVTFGPGGGTVVYNVVFQNDSLIDSLGVSATFDPAATATGSQVSFFAGAGGFMSSLGSGPVNNSTPGVLRSWNFSNLSGGLQPGGTYTIGTLTVSSAVSTNITIGVLIQGDDYSSLGVPVALAPGTSTITVVPEPGTALLMGLGIIGLAVAGRRN